MPSLVRLVRPAAWWALLSSGCEPPEEEVQPVEESDVVEDTPEPETCHLPPEGKCEDNTLIRCVDGERERTECGLAECTRNDEGVYDCIDPEIEGNPEPSDVDDLASLLSGTVTSDFDGIADFRVSVDGETSFLVSATAPAGYLVWLVGLYTPAGDAVPITEPYLNMAVFTDVSSVFAWPSRPEDGPLQDGDWTVALQVTNAEGYIARNVEIGIELLMKTDDDPDRGQVRVALVWAGVAEVDPDLGYAIDLAIEAWRELYDRHDLELIVDQYVAAGVPALMPQPQQDAALWASLSASTEPVDVMVVLAEDFAEAGDELLGIAGQVPGTPMAGPRGGVLVSLARHAGRDGEFDLDEVSFLSSTLGHEVGHYMGLFHPVELTWSDFDPLGDTPECSGEQQCVNRLAENLMFPATTCWTQGCESILDLTDDQVGVTQLYPGTL